MHCMVDIEVAGSTDRGLLMQLSAVAFELGGGVCEPHELLQGDDRWFDAVIEPYTGGEVGRSNMKFWTAPEQAEAKAHIDAQPKIAIKAALASFSKFVDLWLGKRGKMWALPPQFDLRIIRGSYDMFKQKVPWHYSQEHDLRTLLWLATKLPQANFRAPDMEGKGLIKHYALHDAARQATLAQAAYRALTLTGAQRIAATVVT